MTRTMLTDSFAEYDEEDAREEAHTRDAAERRTRLLIRLRVANNRAKRVTPGRHRKLVTR